MRFGSTLPIVLLVGGLAGCGAGASRADVRASESEAWAAQAEAMREHARLIEIEARLIEMDRRLASQARACAIAPETQTADVASANPRPKAEALRSQGDFLAEARVATPNATAPASKVAPAATPQSTPASERERLEQLLDGLREYASNPQSGLSLERREALRVLLRRERQLDLMNPWNDH